MNGSGAADDSIAAAPTASVELRFDVRDGCLCVRSSGTIDTLEATIDFFRRIAVELRRVRAAGLLIVDSSDGAVPDADEFETLAASLRNEGFEGVRTAFVDVKGTAISRIEVGEIVARRHGYHFRVFDSEPLAWLWLRYGKDD